MKTATAVLTIAASTALLVFFGAATAFLAYDVLTSSLPGISTGDLIQLVTQSVIVAALALTVFSFSRRLIQGWF
jgi:hypothetical protein